MAGINLSDGWSLFKNLAKDIGGTQDVKDSDVEKLLKDADLNGDGKVTEDEFKRTVENSATYKEMEERYIEAFKAVSLLDGDVSSISAEDIQAAMDAVQNAAGQNGNVNAGNNDNVGGVDNVGDVDNAGDVDNVGDVDDVGLGDGSGTTTKNFDGMTLDQLQDERTSCLNDVNKARGDKNVIQQQHQANIAGKQAEYTAALNAFDVAQVQDQELANQLTDQKAQKATQDELISTQQTAISEANTALQTAETDLSTAQGNLTAAQSGEPQQSSYTKEVTKNIKIADGQTQTVTETVFDEEAYNTAHEEWQNNLDEAKEAENRAEAAVAEAQQALEAAEEDLEALQAESAEIDAAISETLAAIAESQPELKEACEAIQTSMDAYNQAKADYDTAVKDAEAAIDAAMANLDACTQAISEAKLEEYNKKQSGVASDPEQIADMLNDPELSPADRMRYLQDITALNRDNVWNVIYNMKNDDGTPVADTDRLLVKAMNQLLRDPNATVYDITQIASFYTTLDDYDGYLIIEDPEVLNDYDEAYVKLYGKATSQEEIDYLNSGYSIEALAENIQERNKNAQETKLLTDLYTAVNKFSSQNEETNGTTNISDDDKAAYEEKYLSTGTTSEQLKAILSAVESGEITDLNVANYLLSQVSDGDTSTLISAFRNNSAGMTWDDQEQYIKILFDIVEGKMPEQPETQEN